MIGYTNEKNIVNRDSPITSLHLQECIRCDFFFSFCRQFYHLKILKRKKGIFSCSDHNTVLIVFPFYCTAGKDKDCTGHCDGHSLVHLVFILLMELNFSRTSFTSIFNQKFPERSKPSQNTFKVSYIQSKASPSRYFEIIIMVTYKIKLTEPKNSSLVR